MPPKKKVAALVKVALNAGAATPARRSAARALSAAAIANR